MQRLDRPHIIVPDQSAELLDLFGGDFNGIVHDHPDDAFRTGWGSEGPGVEIVGLSLRKEIHRIHSMVMIIIDFSDFRRGMLQEGLEKWIVFTLLHKDSDHGCLMPLIVMHEM